MKRRGNLDALSTKRDLEEAVAQIASAVAKTVEEFQEKVLPR